LNNQTGIDLNRAGTPLLEIVTEPDMSSAQEAIAYAKKLHNLVQWIGVCDGNMQEGSFRCDVNVSVKPSGSEKLGTRREIKNLNSFRNMEQAINYEVNWQIEQLEDGNEIIQSTVLFNPDTGETKAMRSKEALGLKQVSDSSTILPFVQEVIANNQAMVEQFKSGKDKAFNALVGQVMKLSKGKANPGQVSEILKDELNKV
jgi:Asp-tRNA(Asn)/Glu-tRNA(Gln) amidotransferase B subunit